MSDTLEDMEKWPVPDTDRKLELWANAAILAEFNRITPMGSSFTLDTFRPAAVSAVAKIKKRLMELEAKTTSTPS